MTNIEDLRILQRHLKGLLCGIEKIIEANLKAEEGKEGNQKLDIFKKP